MTPLEAGALARELWDTGRWTIDALTKAAGRPRIVVGIANSKTGSPSTYRTVGPTCPTTCPYLGNGCYAQQGRVRRLGIISDTDTGAAITGTAIAMVAALRIGKTARLHVSGDFAREGVVDMGYVDGVRAVSRTLQGLAGVRWTSWAYTHLPDGAWVKGLRDDGVAVRISDHDGEWGAIVVRSRDEARSLGSVSCPAERTKASAPHSPDKPSCSRRVRVTTCDQCTLCWTRPDLTIAFTQHAGLKLPEER